MLVQTGIRSAIQRVTAGDILESIDSCFVTLNLVVQNGVGFQLTSSSTPLAVMSCVSETSSFCSSRVSGRVKWAMSSFVSRTTSWRIWSFVSVRPCAAAAAVTQDRARVARLKNWLPLGESKSRFRIRCAMIRMLPLRESICVVS